MTKADKVSRLLSYIMVCISNCSLYSREHSAVAHYSDAAVRQLDELYNQGSLSISISGNSLVVNDEFAVRKGSHACNLVTKLKRKCIESIVLKNGMTAKELVDFVSDLSTPAKCIPSYPHIDIGVAAGCKVAEAEPAASTVSAEGVSKVKEVYHGLANFGRLNTAGLEEAVMGLISALKREGNVLSLLYPAKSPNEYSYVHTTNVTMLSIFQARALGFSGDVLHDIGMAGLLHDVGRMYVPAEISEKSGGLTEAEWAEVKKHPAYGAMYLSAFHDVPKIAVVAAFEHHMKFDGTGYPDTKRKGRTQHLASQIVAISDFFDALRSDRPYRPALSIPAVLGIMNESAGKDFNPELVKGFIAAIGKISV